MLDERDRLELLRVLVEKLGEGPAVTLMNHLPPVGWGDVATRHDLEALHREMTTMRAEIGELRGAVDQLRTASIAQTRTLVVAMVAAVFASALAAAGIALGVVVVVGP